MAERGPFFAIAVIASALDRLDPLRFRPHALHCEARSWSETNCYADLWIELLHALGFEPHAMLAHVLFVDVEGDQWTFFKPPHGDLEFLYGIEVQELQLWDGVARHVLEQLKQGRLVLAEVDAFHLPDTSGTTYRSNHAKTTIAIARADTGARRLGYFHNAGYFELEGDDFGAVLEPAQPLPPYVEFVKLERAFRLPDRELRQRSQVLLGRHMLLGRHIARKPAENPITAYQHVFEQHARGLDGDLERFHAYAFASLRQCGAAYELGARYLRWLLPETADALAAAEDLEAIAVASKSALLRLARAATKHKAMDLEPLLAVAPRWEAAFSRLDSAISRPTGEAA
jgi:hypothetical protein